MTLSLNPNLLYDTAPTSFPGLFPSLGPPRPQAREMSLRTRLIPLPSICLISTLPKLQVASGHKKVSQLERLRIVNFFQ